jgi:hypothetical protein
MAKPEPLPQSVILGCNTWNCASKISNANWETKLNEQVNVNQGDSIGVKASFIDTRGTASGNIVIVNDTEISLEYYFYWIHNFNACDISGVTSGMPAPPDASNNLTQQVLVGRDIMDLYFNSPNNVNLPSYFTNTSGTSINDADGLPYLVYQSTPVFPVPGIVGATEDARFIVVSNTYLVVTVGLTINWQYANVQGANYNQLPAGWNLTTDYFVADFNPWYDLPTSAFIPAALASPLPYITYVITNVGNTDWIGIDPGLASNQISALGMVNGQRYAIATTNATWNFEYWGAGSNTVGTVFTATIPPVLPVAFPLTIQNATFLANAATWFIANGGPVFGADPTDVFEIIIGIDAGNNMVVNSVSGAGPWCAPGPSGVALGAWAIPNSFFGFSIIGTPLANQPSGETVINNITSTSSGLSVNDLNVGTSYTVLTTGTLDNSVPQFTWDMVGTFTATTTQNMITDDDYQVIFPQETNLIAGCAFNGLVSELFTSQGGFTVPAIQIYNDTSDVPISDCSLTNEQGTQFMPYLQANYDDAPQQIFISNNTGTGGYNYDAASVLGSGPHEGSPFSELPVDAPYASQNLTLVIPSSVASGSRDPITFTSSLLAGQFNEGNVDTMVSASVYPQPQNLIQFNGVGSVFTATAKYTGTNTTATVEQYTIATCTIDGTGYTPPMVETSVIEVGTVVHAINPDPDLPNDQGGRANVAELQYGSTTPFQYDGYVANYTPPTTRFDIRPVKKKWKMNLKAGSYDPNNLAELITRNMTRQRVKRVNQVKGGPFGTQSTLNVPTDSIWNVGGKDDPVWASPTGAGQNTFYDSKNTKVYGYPSETDYNIDPDQDDMPFLFVPAMNGSLLNNDNNAADYIYAEIPHPNSNGLNNLPNPTYYINLVPLISDVRSVSPTIPSTVQADGYYSILPFYSQNSTTNTDGAVTGNSGIFPIAFGATQTSLIYNNENNGLFSFNYLHSPMLAFLSTNTNDLTEVTAHMYTTQTNTTSMKPSNFFTTLVDKNSGILLNKLEPQYFWSQLGFDVAALTTDLDNPNKIGFQMTYNDFNSKTTGGFCGSSNIFNQDFHAVGSAMQPSVPDTELVFLTATPADVPAANVIVAFNTTPLVIGTSYKIYYAGQIKIAGSTFLLNDWSSIGGPVVNTGDNPAGLIFTATSMGFDPNTPPDGYIEWGQSPTVVLANTPITTITQLQNNYFTVQTTNALNAVKIPTVRDQTGHFLIEIVGYNSIYLDDKSKREIKSIVSSYFVSQSSFVAQVFPESYNYYHVGAPISISNLKIRILDPYTMEEAVIGPNSSVYIQINKMLSDIAIAQVAN